MYSCSAAIWILGPPYAVPVPNLGLFVQLARLRDLADHGLSPLARSAHKLRLAEQKFGVLKWRH